MQKAQEKLKNLTAGDFSPRSIFILLAALVLLWLASGFYTVDPNQVGLNLVFGRYAGKTGPGLNYIWPEPIGSYIKLNVTDRNSIDIGARGRTDSGTLAEVPEESLMLTGDENIADVKFRVIWQIDPAHPEEFAFNIKNQSETIKAVAESAMRELVGRHQNPAFADHRAQDHRAGGAGGHAGHSQFLSRRGHYPAGAIAVGRSAAHRDRGLPRRDGGAAGS